MVNIFLSKPHIFSSIRQTHDIPHLGVCSWQVFLGYSTFATRVLGKPKNHALDTYYSFFCKLSVTKKNALIKGRILTKLFFCNWWQIRI